MKRSTINSHIRAAIDLFDAHRFPLAPFAYWSPAAWRETGSEADEIRRCRLGWDLTDFGRGDFERCGQLLFTMRNGRAADAADTGTSPSTTLGPVKPYAEKVMVAGEVSSLNDDETDNYFIESVRRFPSVEEDEPPLYPLCTEYP